MRNVRHVCLLVVTAVIFVLPANQTHAAGSRSGLHQSASRCSNLQLSVRAIGSQGAAGTIGILFRMHKTWGNGCTVQGYPGAELLDRQFHSLPTHVSRARGAAEPLVLLDSGHDAYFSLKYSDVPMGNATCPRAPYLMVTPPNDRLPIVTYTHGGNSQAYVSPCGGNLTVSPVHASPTFQ